MFKSEKVLARILSTNSYRVQFITLIKWTRRDRGPSSTRGAMRLIWQPQIKTKALQMLMLHEVDVLFS